jgi:hypothetical protein
MLDLMRLSVAILRDFVSDCEDSKVFAGSGIQRDGAEEIASAAAKPIWSRKQTADRYRCPYKWGGRTLAEADAARKATDRHAESEQPGQGVHPRVIWAALVIIVWFVIAMAISFSGTIEADYLFAVVVAVSAIFFTLLLGLAGHAAARGGKDTSRLADFLRQDVAIDTGSISGWEATIQVLTLPATLALGATIIGFIFVVSG